MLYHYNIILHIYTRLVLQITVSFPYSPFTFQYLYAMLCSLDTADAVRNSVTISSSNSKPYIYHKYSSATLLFILQESRKGGPTNNNTYRLCTQTMKIYIPFHHLCKLNQGHKQKYTNHWSRNHGGQRNQWCPPSISVGGPDPSKK